MSRKEAKEQGLKTYDNSKLHKPCGTSLKYVSGWGCVKCLKERGRKNLDNEELMSKYHTPEKLNKKQNKWRKNNPEKVLEQRERAKPKTKIRTQKNKVHAKDQYLKRKYGISLKEYEFLLNNQNGMCAICGIKKCKTGKSFSVDHDHNTGKVRGLLCIACNLKLGQFNNEFLNNIIKYLEKYS
jgi:hypothetical protein